MTAAPAPGRTLFIANGHGEDSIAAEIIRRLPVGYAVDAYPIVGAGGAYAGLCPLAGPRAEIPSQGWRHTRGSVARDLRAMLASIGPAVAFLRAARRVYARTVLVGDAVGLYLALLSGLKIDIYLDVFKSGYAHTYTGAERWLIGRVCGTVFCRDPVLAQRLSMAGIDARSAGNIMLDTVGHGSYDAGARRAHPLAVTLLPGSRGTTGESLALQVAALRLVQPAIPCDGFVAVAPGLDPADLAAASGLVHRPPRSGTLADLGQLQGEGVTLNLARGVTGNLIAAADLVLSQAGTATQQALGLGKPVITFDRGDNRPKRMRDEQALMGEARRLVPPDPEAIAEAMRALLTNPQERTRLGAIGRERIGGTGTADAVVAMLTGR